MANSVDLSIRWARPSATKGEVDVFPTAAFAKVGLVKEFKHYYFQSSEKYFAKCSLDVHELHADLNYAAFPSFSRRHDIAPGITRLHFSDRRRVALTFFEWRPPSEQEFTPDWGTVVGDTADSALFISDLRKAPKTQRIALVRARLGQGDYRQALISYWNGCAVTGCLRFEALRASHIKPWRDATSSQRLDPFNGLLLVGTLDALFDNGLISFSATGRLLRSPKLSSEDSEILGLRTGMRLSRIHAKHRSYLDWHRRKIFQKNG
jgi:hypothetical protein